MEKNISLVLIFQSDKLHHILLTILTVLERIRAKLVMSALVALSIFSRVYAFVPSPLRRDRLRWKVSQCYPNIVWTDSPAAPTIAMRLSPVYWSGALVIDWVVDRAETSRHARPLKRLPFRLLSLSIRMTFNSCDFRGDHIPCDHCIGTVLPSTFG